MQGLHIKKGDTVKVVAGKEKGKTGKVVKVVHEDGHVVVEKVNFVKRHQRANMKSKGGIVEKEAPIHLSNVMVICHKCNKGVRIGHRVLEDGKKVRVCRKCNEILDE